MPNASATAAIVLAVPAVLQVPGVRVMQLSSSSQSSSGILPARRSFQNFIVCVPVPTFWPLNDAFDDAPAGIKIDGMFAENAPIKSAGGVLSQPPMRTTPSIGCDRISSSVSIAKKLR